MCNPDLVKLVIRERDDAVAVSRNSRLSQGKSDHSHSFPRAERVFDCVTMLRTADYDNELVYSVENVLDSLQMAQMKGLEASDIESCSQRPILAGSQRAFAPIRSLTIGTFSLKRSSRFTFVPLEVRLPQIP